MKRHASKELDHMPRISRVARAQLDEPTLSHRLQWHAGQSLRRGIRCSVIVLQPMAIESNGDDVPRDAAGADEHETPLEEVARRLRTILRHTDVVEVDPTVGIGVLLADADEAGTSAVHGRIVRELGQRPVTKMRHRAFEDMRFAMGRASAGPTDAAQLPAVVRDLVCIASAPDLWMCVPVTRSAHHVSGRHVTRGSRERPGASRGRPARRGDLRMLVPTIGAATANDEETRRKADELGVPFVCIPAELPTSLRRMLSAELARDLGALPIGRTRGVLTVAMRDPSDLSALQRLAAATGLTIFPVLASPGDLARALASLDPQVAATRRPVPVPLA